METFKQGMFSSKKVKDFPFPKGDIIEVYADESINSAFRKLVDNEILSSPCWDEQKQEYLGFFDVTDALALIYSVDLLISAIPDSLLNKSTALRLASSGTACPFTEDLMVGSIFEEDFRKFRSRTDIEWNPVTDETLISQVIFLIATSTRRVPVIDSITKRVTKIISQSLVTHVLNEFLKEIEAKGEALPDLFMQTPTSSGGFGITKVLYIDADNNVSSDAFRMIIENGVSAVAVVDEENKLLSSITTKDIRLFNSIEEVALQRFTAEKRKRDALIDKNPGAHLALMDLTGGDFVSMVELSSTKSGWTRVPVTVVNEDTTIRKIVSKLALTRKHRVFVCDEQRHPKGVISVSDIAKLVVTDPNRAE